TIVLEKGQVLTLQSRIQHSMEAHDEAVFLLTLALNGDEPLHPAVSTPTSPLTTVEISPPKEKKPGETKSIPPAVRSPKPGPVVREFRRLLPTDGKPVETLAAYEAGGGLKGLRRALTMTPDEIIEEINRSGLRGRGGAGFPTGVKWAGVLRGGRGKRYVCCNGAEGEPGTFKDRFLLRSNPYLTLEGLAIAAHALGAERIFFCEKRSFKQVADRLTRAIREMHDAHLLPNGRALNIELVLGPEEYLFGEEKALLEVVEGNLPMPRWLAPYIEGLFRQPLQDNPTLVNNAETLANVSLIFRNGPEWFRQSGTPDSPGTMIFTVCGDVQRPGCYELPLGTSLRDLIQNFAGGVQAGRSLKAIFPGVSNGVLTSGHLDVPLDFDSVRSVGSGLGSGGFIVYDDTACIVKVARMFSRFLYVESCGQCPPCKFSSGEITEHLRNIEEGNGTSTDLEVILARCSTVDQGNRCALPTGEHLLIESLVRQFTEEFQVHCGVPCPLPRELHLPKLVEYDERSRSFVYDDHQQFKQPDWSYGKVSSFA
ncbi:MAG TPA: NADH-ubiquinone oxidoreductase-F iron-sulfur binding region domain-containing protein, partial [Bacteroidota bacterium]|nr:NADH-ubiquinone oxidoreductase-F iron-sulfur binding region domain-containing protein [Bacteroidota bacterium]